MASVQSPHTFVSLSGPRITAAVNFFLMWPLFEALFHYKHKVQEGRVSATEA